MENRINVFLDLKGLPIEWWWQWHSGFDEFHDGGVVGDRRRKSHGLRIVRITL